MVRDNYIQSHPQLVIVICIECSLIYRLSYNDFLNSLQNRIKMAQTDRLLSKVKIHKVELDRLESLGIPKRRVRA